MTRRYFVFFLILVLNLSAHASPELLDAVKKGDSVKINKLLKDGADINFRDQKSKRTALLEAIESDRADMVKLLLDNGADPNSIVYSNYGVLCTAAAKSSPEIVKLLVEKGAKPDSQSGAVTHTVLRGQLGLLEWLLAHGGDINEDFPAYGMSPLNAAIDRGDIKTVIFLISKGADINHVHKDSGCTPLMIAAISNKIDSLGFLLENGADASCKDKNGRSVLDYAKTDEIRKILILADKKTGAFFNAVFAGNIPQIKQRLCDGFDVNTRDVTGATALIHSASAGNIEMVKLLLALHADVNIADKRGTCALSAAAKSKSGDIVKMLLAAGAKSNISNNNKIRDAADSPLLSAIKAGDFSIVNDLVESGADVNETSADYKKTTPLLDACRFGSAEMVNYLIEKGAKIDVVDGIGSSPLITAAYAGKTDIVKLLWQKYKQPLFSIKWTALGSACDNGKIEVVKFLIENGADVNIISPENKVSPLMAAYRNPEITEYLITHGADVEHEGGISNSTALSLAVRDDQHFLSRSQLEKMKLPSGILANQVKMHAQRHLKTISVIEILLKAGADPNHKDKSGKSPRDYANNPDTKQILDRYNKKPASGKIHL